MICHIVKKGKLVSCGGCGTIWKNNILVDCTYCGGFGEIKKMDRIPTFLAPKEMDLGEFLTLGMLGIKVINP
jgi:hypothetical protein